MPRVSKSVLAGLVSAVLMVTSGLTPAAAGSLDADYLWAQLVVGAPGTLTSGDEVVVGALEGEGWSVDVVDDDDTAVVGTNIDLVVIAPSTSGVTLGSKYKGTGTPILVFASSAWDDMALSETIGLFEDSLSLVFVDEDHPVNDGLTSPVQVVPTSRDMRSMAVTDLAGGAVAVAARSTDEAENVIFTIDEGAALADSTASPERRAVVGFSDGALANLTASGLQYVMNAVTWASAGEPAFLAAASASPCDSVTSLQACWLFDNSGKVMTDSTSPATSPNWTNKGVQQFRPGGPGTPVRQYFFKGWKGLVSGSAPAFESGDVLLNEQQGQVLATPQSTDSFDPGTGPFTIGMNIRAYGMGGQQILPSGGPDDSPQEFPSYNIVQKGRSTSPGGFWKVSIQGFDHPGTGTNKKFVKGSVACTFKDDAGTEVNAYSYDPASSPGSFAFASLAVMEQYHTIRCARLSDGTVRLQVTPFGATTALTFDAATTLTGNVAPTTETGKPWGEYVSVGKKPESNNAADAFAGWVDWLTVAKS